MDDRDGDLNGTIGYQAPEVRAHGRSIASDLYTAARTLTADPAAFRPSPSLLAVGVDLRQGLNRWGEP